jgi:3-oxoacyl-[acyl-carrier-protein] synthase II
MTSHRVAITGLGAVTPLGNDAEATWRGLVAGRSGIGPITQFDASTYPVRIAGEVKDFELGQRVPDPSLRRRLTRAAAFGVAAAAEALAAASLNPDAYPPHDKGVSIAGSVGRPPLQEFADAFQLMEASGNHRLLRQAPADVIRRSQNVAALVIAQLAGCAGPPITINTACAASAQSIGEAYRRIQDGEVRMMVAGGYDSLTSYVDVLGFALLGALVSDSNDQPERASRPFDRTRAGFVLGEGAVMVVLEDLESAQRRGAPILGEIVGYGSSMNAYRITDSPPDGAGAIAAIRQALAESGLRTDEIDYVAAHGTSTPGNDLTETVALKEVFGADVRSLAISSPKSMTGHLTAAAGALNVLAAVLAIRDSILPPTINLDHPDPRLDLDYVPNVARPRIVRTALVNAFAFGGTNATLMVTGRGSADANQRWPS